MDHLKSINAAAFHSRGIRGQGVVVAVIDNGFDVEHPEFADRIIDTRSLSYHDAYDPTRVTDTDGHGTAVASLIAGRTVGVAPEAHLLLLKTSGPDGINMPGCIDMAIQYAIDWRGEQGERVNIINMSLGSGFNHYWILHGIRKAIANDIIVICAAGNSGDGNPSTDEIAYPAAYPESVAVGSHDANFEVMRNSNSNTEIDLIAPGFNYQAAAGGGGYRTFGATSGAAACVSGASALLHQYLTMRNGRYPTEPELYSELILQTTLDGIDNTRDKRAIGHGRLFLRFDPFEKPDAADIDIEVAVRGLAAAGVIDSPGYWLEIMRYAAELPKEHPEHYRFRYVGLLVKKFYRHII